MPRMGGRDLAEKLRQKREGLAVIFMSGYTEVAVLENAKIGADSTLLNKPFTTEALARKIKEAVSGATSQKSKSATAGGSA